MQMVNLLNLFSKRQCKNIVMSLTFCLVVFDYNCVASETLNKALAKAYLTNPDMVAARINLRKINESVPRAKAGWRPTVSSSLSLGSSYSETKTSGVTTDSSTVPGSMSISVNQSLYTGGRTDASVRQAKSNVQAERSRLFTAEQKILLDGSSAYVGVISARSVVELQTTNLMRIKKQLEATRERFRVGEVTRTDVAQSEARADRAKADRIEAVGTLNSSNATYKKVFGDVPGKLEEPLEAKRLPDSIEATVKTALETNFSLVSAKFEELSALDSVTISKAGLLPTVSLVGRASASQTSGDSDTESTSMSITASINIPLYSGGATYSSIRSAKEEANRRRILVESSRRSVIESSSRAFISWMTARAQAEALVAEVSSAEIALEGVEQEALVGARTVLDVLDAEQERLSAQVNLVQAKKRAFIASYSLLSSLGRLTAEALGLPVKIYDHDRHFVTVEGMLYGDQLITQ
jgi:outer membrane protein